MLRYTFFSFQHSFALRHHFFFLVYATFSFLDETLYRVELIKVFKSHTKSYFISFYLFFFYYFSSYLGMLILLICQALIQEYCPKVWYLKIANNYHRSLSKLVSYSSLSFVDKISLCTYF